MTDCTCTEKLNPTCPIHRVEIAAAAPLEAAPPGPIGTIQGAISPDLRGIARPPRKRV